MVIEGPKVDILEKTRSKNEKVVRIVDEMKRAEVKVLRGDKWQIEGDLVLKKDKLYVPKNKALRVKIIQLYYDIPIAGHKGK